MVAVAVLVDARSLAPIASHTARAASGDPADPADPVPVMQAALAGLPAMPDLAFVDGHGTSHPEREGLATRLGIATGLPCVGVADLAPEGMETLTTLHDIRGAFTPLRDGREQVGWVLRSQVGAAPLVVSPGHKVAMPSAPQLVMRCVRDDRLPEPLRLARAG